MRAVAGARTLQYCWNSQSIARFQEGARIRGPAAPVEIDGEKEAGFVLKHRIDAHHEGIAYSVSALQMRSNGGIRYRRKSLMRASRAFDSRLLADALDPFIRAFGLIPGLAGFAAFEPAP